MRPHPPRRRGLPRRQRGVRVTGQALGVGPMSAGRLPRERHGAHRTPEYRIWCGMLARCRNPRIERYPLYGGRGISVCEKWHRFSAFFADMGPRPSPRHSIDRIDNDGNYEPGNCRWATPIEQRRNSSTSRLLTRDGRTLTAAEWSAELGLARGAVGRRIRRDGWAATDALAPKRRPGERTDNVWIEAHGRRRIVTDWARDLGVSETTVRRRLAAGWPAEVAVTKPSRKRPKAATT